MITAEQVKAAVEAAGITRIEHHDCGMCGYMTAYLVEDGKLYFDPGCDCRWAGAPEPRDWRDAADWINMQSQPDIKARLAKAFGIDLPPADAA
ncbi:hypothetical protein [Pseudorhodoplanes sp.]|uniref:hypothetical protein n=1 Tax=Pseudorhodoplanes sp. TaxID=1934341 RepID=UPI002B9600F9|nr:hypothetical protein [Pseudorhodoplanes sp.]HWV44070.1 hypothetical protein [Pseudorhodoplanes sp.]